MFTIESDNTINITRGDIFYTYVSAKDKETKELYTFQPGDIVRMAVYGKKNCENVVMQKDFLVEAPREKVYIFLEEKDTKIGDIINKATVYWYEIVLNPDTKPQTIIGFSDEGATIFRLLPEGKDIVEADEEVLPEDIPVIDDELDALSNRPVRNKAIAKAVLSLNEKFEEMRLKLENIESEIGILNAKVEDLLAQIAK